MSQHQSQHQQQTAIGKFNFQLPIFFIPSISTSVDVYTVTEKKPLVLRVFDTNLGHTLPSLQSLFSLGHPAHRVL